MATNPPKKALESKETTGSEEAHKADPIAAPTGNAETSGEVTKAGDSEEHGPDGDEQAYDESLRETLACPAGRAWLEGELTKAAHAEEHGPDGTGWDYNESLREPVIARAKFLRALMVVVNAARGAAKA